MSFNSLGKPYNGDTIVAFTSTNKVKQYGLVDSPSLSSWYAEDPDKNHLGLVELFSNQADYRMPGYKKYFKDRAILEVNGVQGKCHYDVEIVEPSGSFTTADTSDFSEYPGLAGSVFPIELDVAYQPGDIITYNPERGQQLHVSEDHVVERNGDTWKHWVQLVTMDEDEYFDKQYLQEGIQYFKVNHSLGEFSTQFSNFEGGDNVSTMTLEFELGGHRGVETFYTMYADKKTFSGAAVHAREFWNRFANQLEQFGKDNDGYLKDIMIIGKLDKNGKLKKDTTTIGSTLEYLVLLELMKMEAYALNFQKGGIVKGIDGTKRLSEGAWHQFRRGNVFTYSRKGGITKSLLRQAMAVLFQNRKDLSPQDRYIKFDCGYFAYMNMLNLFREEVMAQIQALGVLMGNEKFLPHSPVQGKSLTSLTLEPVMFTKVNIPEIGWVEINHDPAMDYSPMSDRRGRGFYGEGGYAHSAYSMMITDATDANFSNARRSLPTGAKLVAGGNERANVYYVKPEGENMWWGYSNGRYSPQTGREIISTSKTMSREFWAHNVSGALVLDVTRSIIIELQEIPTAFRRI